jgi:hypothetical protein
MSHVTKVNRVGAVEAGHDTTTDWGTDRTTSIPTLDEGNHNLQARAAGQLSCPRSRSIFLMGKTGLIFDHIAVSSQPLGGSISSLHLFRGVPVCMSSTDR